MLIKNLQSVFCTDQYSEMEILSILCSDNVVKGIKKRRELLIQNEWLTDNTTIEYTPVGIDVRDSNIQDDTVTVRMGTEAMLFIITDDNGVMYETESVPYEALDKERFLLYFTDDRGVVGYEDGNDVKKFEAIYADSLEEAKQILLDAVKDARKAFNEPDFQAESELPWLESEDPATDEILLLQ